MNARTDKAVLHQYLQLPQGDKIQVLYVWIDGTRENLRSKTRTIDFVPNGPEGRATAPVDGLLTPKSEENWNTFQNYAKLFLESIFSN